MDRKLRTPAAAEFLGVKPNTLEIWRHQRRGPKFYKVGRCVVYDRNDLPLIPSPRIISAAFVTTDK